MDNCQIHHGPEILALVKAHGVHVEYLPPYSDLNPIEEACSKIKVHIWRNAVEFSISPASLYNLYECGKIITQDDVEGYIYHTGFWHFICHVTYAITKKKRPKHHTTFVLLPSKLQSYKTWITSSPMQWQWHIWYVTLPEMHSPSAAPRRRCWLHVPCRTYRSLHAPPLSSMANEKLVAMDIITIMPSSIHTYTRFVVIRGRRRLCECRNEWEEGVCNMCTNFTGTNCNRHPHPPHVNDCLICIVVLTELEEAVVWGWLIS